MLNNERSKNSIFLLLIQFPCQKVAPTFPTICLLGSGRASSRPEGRDGPVREEQDTPLHLGHAADHWQLPQLL